MKWVFKVDDDEDEHDDDDHDDNDEDNEDDDDDNNDANQAEHLLPGACSSRPCCQSHFPGSCPFRI